MACVKSKSQPQASPSSSSQTMHSPNRLQPTFSHSRRPHTRKRTIQRQSPRRFLLRRMGITVVVDRRCTARVKANPAVPPPSSYPVRWLPWSLRLVQCWPAGGYGEDIRFSYRVLSVFGYSDQLAYHYCNLTNTRFKALRHRLHSCIYRHVCNASFVQWHMIKLLQ